MESIDKLKKIRAIVAEKVGDNDEDGLLPILDEALERMEPKETEYDILEKRVREWLDNVANGVENTVSKDTILSDVEAFASGLKEKENPFKEGTKVLDNAKFRNEEEKEARRKEAFSIWEKEKYNALKNLSYQISLLKSAN